MIVGIRSFLMISIVLKKFILLPWVRRRPPSGVFFTRPRNFFPGCYT
jgi:hypothetical protein